MSISSPPVRSRAGYTLIELVISLASATVLMAGLASAIYVSVRATDSSFTPAGAAIDASAAVTELRAELEFAIEFTTLTSTTIEFTSPDRDSDGDEEEIRYQWSGVSGDSLTRQYNSSTPAVIAENVTDFSVSVNDASPDAQYAEIRLRVGNDSNAVIETAFPLLNQS